MHVHLPKPLHGWRAFVGEVGIIVIGVLIALGAEQVVEDWQWRHKVAVVRKSLLGELANDRARWDVDLKAANCAEQVAGRIRSWAHAGATGPVPSAPDSTELAMLTMHSTNWTLAANSQALEHFPIAEQLAFAALYAGLANRQVSVDQASIALDRIHALVPLASDPAARRELLESLGDLSAADRSMIRNERYMNRHFDALGVKPDESDFAADLSFWKCDR
jgi:hypothetical protein